MEHPSLVDLGIRSKKLIFLTLAILLHLLGAHLIIVVPTVVYPLHYMK